MDSVSDFESGGCGFESRIAYSFARTPPFAPFAVFALFARRAARRLPLVPHVFARLCVVLCVCVVCVCCVGGLRFVLVCVCACVFPSFSVVSLRTR